MIKLVLADMDGTLVPNSVKTASARTCAAIDKLRASGIAFGCATGRSIANTLMQFSYQERYVTDGIFAAGKQVLVGGELVRSNPFPHDLLVELAVRIAELDYAILVAFMFGADKNHPLDAVPCSMGENPEKIDRVLEYYRVPGRNANLWDNWQYLPGLPEEDVFTLGVLLAGGQDDVPRMSAFFAERFPEASVLNAAPGWMDVNYGHTSKATPYPEFLEATGLDPNEVLFFADSQNDIELMKQIPNSVCVANAMPVAAAYARYTVPADVDDGPAQLMEALAETGGDLEAALALL